MKKATLARWLFKWNLIAVSSTHGDRNVVYKVWGWCGCLPAAGTETAARHTAAHAAHGAADGGGGGGVDTLGAAADGAARGEAVERGAAVEGAACTEGVGRT